MDELEAYKAEPLYPAHVQAKMPKVSTRKLYIPGEILGIIHEVLPYRITYEALKRTTPEQKEELQEFLSTFGPEAFHRDNEMQHRGYKYNPKGEWARIMDFVYCRDGKIIIALKLAFG